MNTRYLAKPSSTLDAPCSYEEIIAELESLVRTQQLQGFAIIPFIKFHVFPNAVFFHPAPTIEFDETELVSALKVLPRLGVKHPDGVSSDILKRNTHGNALVEYLSQIAPDGKCYISTLRAEADLIERASLLLIATTKNSNTQIPSDFDKLAAMINNTAPVLSYQVKSFQAFVDKEWRSIRNNVLSDIEMKGDDSAHDSLLLRVLQSVCRMTQSDRAHLQLRHPNQRLQCIKFNPRDRGEQIAIGQVRKGRAAWSGAYKRSNRYGGTPKRLSVWFENSPLFLVDEAAFQGVIDLRLSTRSTQSRHFLTQLVAEVGRRTLDLLRSVHVSRVDQLIREVRRETAGTPSLQKSFGVAWREYIQLPPEFRQDVQQIKRIIAFTRKCTFARSVTVRLLSRDRTSLCRVFAAPPESHNDSYEIIETTATNSVNARVFRTGLFEYHTEAGETDILHARPDIKSELCYPIFVNGSIVGTLNLESTIQNAFDAHQPFMAVIATMVGEALTQIRQDSEMEVFSYAARLYMSAHNIEKAERQLEKQLGSPFSKVETINAMKYALGRVRDGLRNARTPIEPIGDAEPKTVRRLINESFAFKGLMEKRSDFSIEETGELDQTLENKIYQWARPAFGELFHNAVDALFYRKELSQPPVVKVRVSKVDSLEQPRVRVQMMQPVNAAIDEVEERLLFFRPIVREEETEVHLGAFIAGTLIRALRGDVWVEENSDSRVVVTVELPIASTDVK